MTSEGQIEEILSDALPGCSFQSRARRQAEQATAGSQDSKHCIGRFPSVPSSRLRTQMLSRLLRFSIINAISHLLPFHFLFCFGEPGLQAALHVRHALLRGSDAFGLALESCGHFFQRHGKFKKILLYKVTETLSYLVNQSCGSESVTPRQLAVESSLLG